MKATQIFTAACLLMAAPTFATPSNECQGEDCQKPNYLGFYVGGQLGYAKTDFSIADIEGPLSLIDAQAQVADVDRSSSASSLYVGYALNQYFAVEAGYSDLGERALSFSGTTTNLEQFGEQIKVLYPESGKGFTFALRATYPLTKDFSLSGKLGYMDWESKYNTKLMVNSDIIDAGGVEPSGQDMWYGISLDYDLTQSAQLYAAYERISFDRDDVGTWSAGVRYFFGENQSQSPKAQPLPITASPVDSDNDGVIDNDDRCAATPFEHMVDTEGCSQYVEKVAEIELTVYFENNSSIINKQYFSKIDELAQFIIANDVELVTISGHASKIGSAKYNQNISLKRADNVKQRLVKEFAIPATKIVLSARGESMLISKEAKKNRRAYVHWKKARQVPMLKSK